MRTYSARVAQRHAPGAGEARDWRTDAACAGHDPELFFGLTPADEGAALAICRQCPVTVRCRDWADEQGILYGVWAGETEQQRRTRLAGGARAAGSVAMCEQCGGGYRRDRAGQRFCSPRCHHASMAMRGKRCGTTAAARRHRKRGEPMDDACRLAEALYRAQLRARRREPAGVPA